jgi:hypothetical protein
MASVPALSSRTMTRPSTVGNCFSPSSRRQGCEGARKSMQTNSWTMPVPGPLWGGPRDTERWRPHAHSDAWSAQASRLGGEVLAGQEGVVALGPSCEALVLC